MRISFHKAQQEVIKCVYCSIFSRQFPAPVSALERSETWHKDKRSTDKQPASSFITVVQLGFYSAVRAPGSHWETRRWTVFVKFIVKYRPGYTTLLTAIHALVDVKKSSHVTLNVWWLRQPVKVHNTTECTFVVLEHRLFLPSILHSFKQQARGGSPEDKKRGDTCLE